MIIVPGDRTNPREYALPRGVHVNVPEGERVRAGERLQGVNINDKHIEVISRQMMWWVCGSKMSATLRS